MKKHTLLLACAMRILLNLIALPRWGAKNVLPLNLIAFPSRGRCPKGADRVTMA